MNDDRPEPGASGQPPPSLRRSDGPADAFPARPDAPVSSNLRKEQVRAALFRKLEPIRVGRFILLEPLGAGAMGEIYAAYDDQLDRKVALKLVRSGSELKADERLLREAQTLAQVSHPNVVQIYEAGTCNGRLFIAMELIRGKTLTSWLRDAARLPRAVRQREILHQFLAAGRGLEAAHAAGVAHRDFKPDNVLVGDDGRVRVVDFGLARALVDDAVPGAPDSAAPGVDAGGGTAPGTPSKEEIARGPTVMLDTADRPGHGASSIPLVTGASTIDHEPPAASPPRPTWRTPPAKPGPSSRDTRSSSPRLKAAVRLTETGTVMGTPCFMAPEQMRGAVADLRSDQFSFCVALYHALYDSFPFPGRSLRELRDSMESDAVEFVPSVPVPAFVRRALHRGLSVEPAQRFPGMAELLAALAPRSRRRGWIAAAASLIAIALGAGLYLRPQAVDPCAAAGIAIDAEWPADRQVAMHAAFVRGGLPFAASAWRGAKTQIDGYAGRWRGEAVAACRATHVAHTQSAQQLDKRMLCLDRGRRQLAALVGELGTGAPDAVEHAIEAAGALPDLTACSRAENLLFGLAPPAAPVAAEVARIRDRLAQALTLELLGRYEESLAIARDASTMTERLSYAAVHAEALAQVARALDKRGTGDAHVEAQRLYFEALTIAEAERHDQLTFELWNKLVILALRVDGGTVQAHRWWGMAEAWWRRNANARSANDGADGEAELHHVLGEIYYRETEYAKAASEERRAIAALSRAPAHQLELSRYYDALAKSLEYLDDLDEARRLHERALTIAVETLGAGHPNVIKLQINYGKALEKCGQRARARSMLEDALASMPAGHRESHLDAALIYSFLSDLDYQEGQLDRAAEYGRASLEIYQRTQTRDPARLAEAYTNLANVELRRRSFLSALALYENALALRRRQLGNGNYQIGVNEGSIAETLVEIGRYDEAMHHLVEAERIFQRSSGRERGTQAWMLTVRGEILAGQRQFGAAVPVLEHAQELFGDSGIDPTNHALAMWTLARALHALAMDEDHVRSLAERAHVIFAAQGAVDAHNRDAVASFLSQLPRVNGPAERQRPD